MTVTLATSNLQPATCSQADINRLIGSQKRPSNWPNYDDVWPLDEALERAKVAKLFVWRWIYEIAARERRRRRMSETTNKKSEPDVSRNSTTTNRPPVDMLAQSDQVRAN